MECIKSHNSIITAADNKSRVTSSLRLVEIRVSHDVFVHLIALWRVALQHMREMKVSCYTSKCTLNSTNSVSLTHLTTEKIDTQRSAVDNWLSWCWQTRATRLEVSQGHQTLYHVRYGFLLVFYRNFVPKTHRFWHSRLQKCRELENRVRVRQSHWKGHHSIERIGLPVDVL